jgi:xylan 1,4-beta-xylosidase
MLETAREVEMGKLVWSVLIGAAFVASQLAAQPVATPARYDYVSYRGSDPIEAGVPASRNEYKNPVLPGFYPDPSVVKVGSDFYLVNSTFSFFPGIPISKSSDLVNWTQIGNAIDRPSQLDLGGLGIARGVFAATISFHVDTFYIVSTCIDCKGNFIISAKNPAGPWSDPVWLDFDGIDPSLFVDATGRAWILNNGPPEGTPLYDGHRAIWMQEFDLASLKLKGPRTVVVNGGVDISKKPIWTEGPHVFNKDGFYYLIAAEGGTHIGHSQTVFKSRFVTGPYLPAPTNPILTQRDLLNGRPFAVQATGHADFVALDDGSWWSVFLGTRPYEGSLTNLGRETFLLPVTWKDGWPEILPKATPVPLTHVRPNLPRSSARPDLGHWKDDFNSRSLAPDWLMLRTPLSNWYSLDSSRGQLVVQPTTTSISSTQNPAFLGRRQRHRNMSLETRLTYRPQSAGDRAGLAAFADEANFLFVGITKTPNGDQVIVTKRARDTDAQEGEVIASQPINASGVVRLKIQANGPDYSFSFAQGSGPWTVLAAQVDGTILSTDKAAMFTGTVWGPYAKLGPLEQRRP